MDRSTTSSTSRDDLLAALLAQLTEQQTRNGTADIDAIAAANPDLADELRSLWATAQFAAVFVRPPASTVLLIANGGGQENPFTLPHGFGDYELLEELGRGGMGVVFRARQRSLDRIVAIKLMRDARLSSESDRNRFHVEATSSARLKHPNIVTVHEVGTWEGQPYLVMEYVNGQTLSQWIAEHGPMPPREAARIIAAAARAVQHAHDHGILHRDLKPANLLIVNGKEPVDLAGPTLTPKPEMIKVADFGLAKRLTVTPSAADWRTQTGAIIGTPSYMAPEQAGGRKELTPAADVYSLGAVLYELLTGRPPFHAANPVDTLLMVIEQEPIPPRELDPGVDRDLEMICLKCLQKPPALRYGSAGDLARDLEAYLAGETLSSSPSGLGYFLTRLLRETHHVAVLENWGVLWMWHSLAVFLLCLATQILAWSKVEDHRMYLMLWTIGLVTWGTILWQLRRRAGPVLFVERQLAHAWAAGVCASIAMFVIEVQVNLPALVLSPAIAVAAGMVFVFKAGILSGRFYITAALLFLTAAIMPMVPQFAILLFGIMSALSFFVPGLKYYRLRKRELASRSR